MRGFRWFTLLSAVALSVWAVSCSDDDDGGGAGGDIPPPVLTATALATDPTAAPSGEATGAAGAVGEYVGDDATDFLDFVLLKPTDIAAANWVIQSDTSADNAAEAAANPEAAASIERCGRLLSRTITNFPPDAVAAFFDGTTLSYFSTGTVYETAEGAVDCSAEAATRLAEPGALARTFGDVFTSPDGVVVTPVEYEPVGDGTFAATLRGTTDAGGTEIDLTILVVSFRDRAATYAVGMAVSGIEPTVEELKPYVDLVYGRSQEAQQ